MQNDKESLSISNLKGLIKQNRNADFQSLTFDTELSLLIVNNGMTLMHTAAASNNFEIISFLFSSGLDINAKNDSGQTPIHSAILNRRFQSVQLLLSLNADILAADYEGITPLHFIFLKDNEIPKYITLCFLERLKRTEISSRTKADYLIITGCSIKQALVMNDAEVTNRMLKEKATITKEESHTLIKCAMSSGYPENVRVLVQRGPGRNERREFFLDHVITHRFEPNMKFYINRLIEWNVITEDFINKAASTFKKGTENDIQIYLDLGIDQYIRNNLGWELLVGLFGNYKVDWRKIIKNREFDVNSFYQDGSSALHFATGRNNKSAAKSAVTYLLANNANPNIRDSSGRTPLFLCVGAYIYNEGLADLLLEAGADLLAVDNRGKGIFSDIHEYFNERIIAELCILEAKGLSSQNLDVAVKRLASRKELLQRFRSDLAWLKTQNVTASLTLFTLLADEVTKTARYVKTKESIAIVQEASRKRQLEYVCASIIKKKLKKIIEMNKLRSTAAIFLSDAMNIHSDHLVVEKIVDYLTFKDLSLLDKAVSELYWD